MDIFRILEERLVNNGSLSMTFHFGAAKRNQEHQDTDVF